MITGPFLLLLSCLIAPSFAFEPYVDKLPIPPRISVVGKKNPKLTIKMSQFKTKLHRDLPETFVWGYNGVSPGPTIEVERGQKLTVEWINDLPKKHVFAAPADSMVDPSLPDVRAVVHLHGAVVTQTSTTDRLHNNDGWPDAWLIKGQKQIAEYPNDQTARILWYHDHAMGVTGRNVAAGLEGMYLIHDPLEKSLNLPTGAYDIPLILQPRLLNEKGVPIYSKLLFNEYFGNSFMVNGKLYPYLEVEPRKYRFRFLNSSNARFVSLRFVNPTNYFEAGPAMYQLASDSGFFEKPVLLGDPAVDDAPRLQLAPAERADVIVDFSNYAGKSFLLHNNAIPEDADGAFHLNEVMLFKVGTKVTKADSSSLPTKMQKISRIPEANAIKTRQIVFNEMPMGDSSMLTLNGKMWHDPTTEFPELGSTEIWELINTLPDSHPFHIHLVDFQVLDRRPFDLDEYNRSGKITYTGVAEAPELHELAWKDTVRVTVGHVTRIIMKFGPYPGHYVYHCHILEHEDMDMMRPFDVVAPGSLRLSK